MTEVTVKEPKTVTEEVTRYECDNCGYRGTDEEVKWQGIGDPKTGSPLDEQGHLCLDCAEAEEYATLVELHEDKEKIAELINWGISWGPPLVAFSIGVAPSVFVWLNTTSVEASRIVVLWIIGAVCYTLIAIWIVNTLTNND